MVVPCIPCAVAAAPSLGPPLATLFGVGATAVVARRTLKGCKTQKNKKNKDKKNKDKKNNKDKNKNKKNKGKSKNKDKKSMVGGRHTRRKRVKVEIKDNSKNCCRCSYIKKNGKLFKIRGQWPHCSYDTDNCCKDKKSIVNWTKTQQRKKDAKFKNIINSVKDKSPKKQSRRLTRSGNRNTKKTNKK